ncbi:FeoA family protein [Peptoniphilus raoultii]|uniref:FeoA family protein n=1 Tax=Peptoniphilus raoultii TaxID=1776387 RepID=UPI0008D9C98A|nr:FeoA family protein [Peptoniphilus raoultii]
MNLSEAKEGQSVIVTGFTADLKIRRRLQDLGMIKGTEIKCLSHSPMGDPTAYLIRRAVIAIRQIDAKEVLVREVEL